MDAAVIAFLERTRLELRLSYRPCLDVAARWEAVIRRDPDRGMGIEALRLGYGATPQEAIVFAVRSWEAAAP